MPTKEQLESALINADKAGDVEAAKVLANALKSGQYDQTTKPAEDSINNEPAANIEPTQDDSIPGWLKPIAELAAASNKSLFQMLDFIGADNLNAVLQLAGAETRVPTLTGSFGSDGNYMEEGLSRDIVKGVGSAVPMAIATGAALRQGAAALPNLAPGESAGSGVLRQMAQTTAKQDATAGALAATGGEIGEEIGGTTGRIAGSVALPAGAVAAKELTKEGVKQAFRKGSEKPIRQAINDFAEINSTPTLGQATGDPLRAGIETRSGQVFGGGAIRKSINKTINNMQNRLQGMADDISKTSGDVETGRVIQKGITGDDGFVARFQDKSGSLWRQFDDLIDPQSQVAAKNTQETLEGLVRQSEVGKIFNNPMVARVKDALEASGGNVDYRTFRELRTAIGSRLGSKELISDIPRADLKRLYGALSRDLGGIANETGDDAVKALTRANRYTAAGHKRLDDFVERIATKVDLDKVYAAMARGGEGTQALNAMKRSLKPDEWEAVAANVIRGLGKATNANQDMAGEVFSVNKFLTDWNKLGQSRKVLFSGSTKLNEYSKNLDKIARVAERIKQTGAEGANASGTGQMLANSGIGAGIVGGAATGNLWAVGGLISAVAANKGASTLMTSPKFVNWLAQSSSVKDLPKHITRLEIIGNSEGLTEEIGELLQDLQEQADSNPTGN